MSERRVITVSSGQYDEYRWSHYYIPEGFSWASVARELKKRKYLLNWQRPKHYAPEDVMDMALRSVGCEPVASVMSLHVDGFYAEYDENDKPTYAAADRFIATVAVKEVT